MESKVNYAIVGLFVLVFGAALVGGVLWLASGGATRKAYDTYYAYMDESVSGLNVDAVVRYRGVEVGRVRKIALAMRDIEKVQLTLSIARGTPVKVDTVAVLRMQGLTGIVYVDLAGGRSDSPPLTVQGDEEFPVIKSAPSLMERLDTAVNTLLTNANRTSERLNALLDEDNRRSFARILENVESVSRALASRSAAIEAGVANAARTMENSARATAELSRLIERVERSTDGFDRMVGTLERAGATATDTLAAARSTFDGARTTLEDSRVQAQQFAAETLPEAQQFVTELRELTASLRRFSDQMERNPSVLLYGIPPSKRGPGE